MPAPVNTDLSSSNLIPGVYVQIQTASGSSVDNPNKRALILGMRQSSGGGAPNTPKLYTSQSDIEADHGAKSEVARAFAAFQSQYGPGEFEAWACGVNEPGGGTAATRLIVVAGTASAAGYVDVYVAGYKATVGIESGDTAAEVATAIYGALGLLPSIPVTLTDSGSGTVTLTYAHKGLAGNDLPIRLDQFDAAGLTFSPGSVSYSGTASSGGAITVTMGASVVSYTVSNSDANTATATGMAAAINAADNPCTASASSGTVTLLYRKGRYLRRISASMGSVGTQTVSASAGTTGAGMADTTAALANVSALSQGFAAWVTTFVDPDGSNADELDRLYDALQTDCNGVNQKPGLVFLGSAAKLSTAGANITAASPDLTTTSPLARFSLAWCREAAVQAFEIAARAAAAYLHPDYFAKNLDGTVLSTRGTVPLLNPATADQPPLSDQNASMLSYYMTPIVADAQGNLVILRSMTTSNSSNQDLRETSTIRQLDTARQSLRVALSTSFTGRSYRASNPKTPNTVTTGSVKQAIYVWARSLDDQDLFDDAEAWKDAIQVSVNALNNTRFDAYVPLAIIRNLHQIGAVLQPQ